MISELKPYPEVKDSGVEWLGDVPAHWNVVPNGSHTYMEFFASRKPLVDKQMLIFHKH